MQNKDLCQKAAFSKQWYRDGQFPMGHSHADAAAHTWILQLSASPEPEHRLPAAGLHQKCRHVFGKIPHAAEPRGAAETEIFPAGYNLMTCSYSMCLSGRELEASENYSGAREKVKKGSEFFFLLGDVHKVLPLKCLSLTWLSSDTPQTRLYTILTSHIKY